MEGMAKIHICAQDVQATLNVAVSSELKESMLISCDDLCKLRVIPADFPNTVLVVKTNEQLIKLKRKFLNEFEKTLSNDLNPLPMNCDPMSIKLQPDAIPVCVTTAHTLNQSQKRRSPI